MVVSSYTQSTSPIEAATKDGRVVILKTDGTWVFKKVVTQPLPTPVVSSVKQQTNKVSAAQIKDVVQKEFGNQVEAETRLSSDPFYLFGDFNGDAYADVAVLVNVEQGRDKLKEYGVKYVSTDSYSPGNGSQLDPVSAMGNNCLGIAFIHGTKAGWNAPNMNGKFLVYDCFSAFRLFGKGRKVIRGSGSEGATPKPVGDSIFLQLETGGTSLVYWNGRTYRGFGLRTGD